MKYAIRKRGPDERVNTCGFKIEDGMVRVVECDLYNASDLINVLWFGYLVYSTDAPTGYYTDEVWSSIYSGTLIDPVRLGMINPEMDRKLDRDLDRLPELF